jgi:hypothetical protein
VTDGAAAKPQRFCCLPPAVVSNTIARVLLLAHRSRVASTPGATTSWRRGSQSVSTGGLGTGLWKSWRLSYAARQMTGVAACLALFVVAPGVAHAMGGMNPSQLFDVSCPSTTQCTALGEAAEFTFNPQAPGPVVPVSIEPGVPLAPPFLTAIDCPSTHQCTAVGWKGTEITFDPTRPGILTAPAIAPESVLFDWLSCPSVSQCTAASNETIGLTFDPQAPASGLAFPSPHVRSIACPSATECTILFEGGQEAAFDPNAPGSPNPRPLSAAVNTGQLACVLEHQCTAVGTSEITFDPVGPGTAPRIIASGSLSAGSPWGSVTCPSTTQCTVLRYSAETQVTTADTFDPLNASTPTLMSVGTEELGNLSCPSTNQCTTIDRKGRETTFDPNTPQKPAASVVIDRLEGKLASVTSALVSGTRVTVDVRCVGFYGACPTTLRLFVRETLRGGRVVAVSAARPASSRGRRGTVRTLTLALVRFPEGHSNISLELDAAGRRLLAAQHRLPVDLELTQPGSPPMLQTLLFTVSPRH